MQLSRWCLGIIRIIPYRTLVPGTVYQLESACRKNNISLHFPLIYKVALNDAEELTTKLCVIVKKNSLLGIGLDDPAQRDRSIRFIKLPGLRYALYSKEGHIF